MASIHCHVCGGFIANPAGTKYRSPSGAPQAAAPHSAFCMCDHAVIYGLAPEPTSSLRGVHRIRSASRN